MTETDTGTDFGGLLVFGQTGQVARALARLAPGATYLGRTGADLTDPAACAAAIEAHKPRAVINAAAYTAVDAAEDDAETAHLVNAAAPGAMARACAALAIPMVHISTDYVFDGSGTASWQPGDATNVVVDYQYSMFFPLLFGTEIPLSSESKMRIE